MRRALAATAAAAALLAGCGDSERPPEDVARRYVASDDPAKCADAAPQLLERSSGKRGEAARAACRASVERTEPPRDVRVTETEVTGGRARVAIEADGQDVTVRLTRQDGRWLVAGFGG